MPRAGCSRLSDARGARGDAARDGDPALRQRVAQLEAEAARKFAAQSTQVTRLRGELAQLWAASAGGRSRAPRSRGGASAGVEDATSRYSPSRMVTAKSRASRSASTVSGRV